MEKAVFKRKTNTGFITTSMPMKKSALRVVTYTLLMGLSMMFILPFLWLISTSLKPESEAITFPPTLIPKVIEYVNYKEVFEIVNFAQFYWNTIIVTVFTVLGTVMSSAFVAYGFARIKGRGRNLWFAVLLATMMLPPQVTMIPVYLIFSKLGWVNTFLPLVVPAFLGNAFFIFLLRQFLKGIPKELEEAAVLDGCNTFGIFLKIMVPLSRPALITVAILSFMWTWNDFLNPLIYLNDESKYTLALGLQMFYGPQTVLWGPMMAACIMIILPVMALFFFAQRYFVQGIATSGLKG